MHAYKSRTSLERLTQGVAFALHTMTALLPDLHCRTSKSRSLLRLLAALFCWAAVAAQAHEFWLMPQSFSVPPAEKFLLELRVGAGWPGESLGRNPAYVERFGLIESAAVERPVGGEPGGDPAGVVTAKNAGPAWTVFRSKRSALTLAADKFESYLRDEGLEAIIDTRRLSGTSQAAGRELYSRCAKALLQVGSGHKTASAMLKRNTGLTLELIPQTDPQPLRGGGAFTVQLLYLNKPLRGALVKALPQFQAGETTTPAAAPAPAPAPQITGRTDAQGRVTLPLSHGGVWLINAVHMVAAPPQLGADWESVWSSLVFEVPGFAARP